MSIGWMVVAFALGVYAGAILFAVLSMSRRTEELSSARKQSLGAMRLHGATAGAHLRGIPF